MTSNQENDRIGIKINNRTLRKLQKHISSKNFSENLDLTQQDWINKAISEKLSREQNKEAKSQNILRGLSIRLEKEIRKELDQLLTELKEKGDRSRSLSKKGWILEAIEEKLERDES